MLRLYIFLKTCLNISKLFKTMYKINVPFKIFSILFTDSLKCYNVHVITDEGGKHEFRTNFRGGLNILIREFKVMCDKQTIGKCANALKFIIQTIKVELYIKLKIFKTFKISGQEGVEPYPLFIRTWQVVSITRRVNFNYYTSKNHFFTAMYSIFLNF